MKLEKSKRKKNISHLKIFNKNYNVILLYKRIKKILKNGSSILYSTFAITTARYCLGILKIKSFIKCWVNYSLSRYLRRVNGIECLLNGN